MSKWWLFAVVLVGCAKKGQPEPPPSGSASASGSAPVAVADASIGLAIDASIAIDAAAAANPNANKKTLELSTGEKLRAPTVEMPWIPPAGWMKVTLVDVEGTPPTARLVVWGEGKRHVVIDRLGTCLTGEHGAEISTGKANTVVFRCETQDKAEVIAEEWLIAWPKENDAPIIDKHWRGKREERDAPWAGGRELYKPAELEPAEPECCCSWQDEGEESYEWTTKRYCKGSSDHHGICVGPEKCKTGDE